ncbi:aldose 1-epimerase family protein [Zhihengliuella sp.]|uniref:aldose 1-epimerase family protein n=1 Tax=Zhihengliuella sp. TaxID=1954483 RepID=UPI002811E1B0|nr:aldose 1-epimerase family protein [Zhihengliuella sp.]
MNDREYSSGRLSGEQFVLRAGGAEATIAALAGSLRSYERDGVQLTETFDADEVPPLGCGILLAPWPNRVAAAQWQLDGRTQQLDITEPATGNAIHGLLRNTGYTAEEQTDAAVTLTAEIYPQHGYGYRMTHRARYALDEDGQLSVTQTLVHHAPAGPVRAGGAAPAALGAHPYLRVGDVPTDELTLTTTAGQYLPVDGRKIPTGVEPVAGDLDFRTGRRIAGLRTDTAFARLEPAADGRHHHRLDAPDGRAVELWTDPSCPYVHIFVTDQYPQREAAVAIEPMTAPANAFNSGDGLLWLAPGDELTIQWGITSWL